MDDQQLLKIDRKIAEQRKWVGFMALGILLILGGALSLWLPVFSEFAASTIFGVVLMGIGGVKIIQSLWIKSWSGFVWQELSGAVELVGGVMIYLNPLKGALAITLLIAIVLLVHGFLQVAMSLKIRSESGCWWFTLSGFIALTASVILVLKLPLTKSLPSGSIAGIALLIAGIAYLGSAFSTQKA